MAKYRKYKSSKTYMSGGQIGSTAGALLGSIIPGVGTAIGGGIGGMLGGLIGGNKNQELTEPPMPVEPAMRFENGGKKEGTMVSADSPEYRKAYEEFRVQGQLLPEIDVVRSGNTTADNPIANAARSYMNTAAQNTFAVGKNMAYFTPAYPIAVASDFADAYGHHDPSAGAYTAAMTALPHAISGRFHGPAELAAKMLKTPGKKYLKSEGIIGNHPMQMGGMLTPIEAGGSHSENGLGGVPIGNNASVEQGETMTEDFVYSDKLKINKTLAKEFSLPKSTIGKTFAQASKSLTINQEDVISQRGNKRTLNRIAEAQEAYKQSFGDKYYQNAAQQNNELPVAQYGLDMRQLNMPSQPVFNPLDPMGFDRTANLNLNLQVPNLTGTENIQTPEQSAVTPESDVASDTSLSTASFSPLRYAPLAADVYSLATAERPTPMDASRYQQFGTFTENLVDRSQMRKGVMDTASTTANYLREASGGNAALFNAMMQSGSTGTQRTMGELSMQADIQDAQERARVEGLKNRQQAMNTQIQQQIDIQNQQDLAAYNNMIQDSVVNLAQNIGNIGTEQTRISQVNQLFGYDVHGQYKQAKKDGATDKSFLEYAKGLLGNLV